MRFAKDSAMPMRSLLLALFSTAMFSPPHAAAGNAIDAPLASANRHPLVRLFGLPDADGAAVAPAQQWQWRACAELANTFLNARAGDEALLLDGESTRLTLALRRGLGAGWEVGVQLPWLSQRGGFLDGNIENWHDFWGLPNAGREKYPADQFRQIYLRDGQTLLYQTEPVEGIGDVRLQAGWQWFDDGRSQWAWRVGVELPTGEADDLLGSDSVDVSNAIHYSRQGLFNSAALSLHSSAGLLWMSEGEVLTSVQNELAGFGSTALSWSWRDGLALKAQLDYHSALFDSELRELGAGSVQLLLGGSVQLASGVLLDLAVSEDIYTSTAPDVVFMLGLRVQAD